MTVPQRRAALSAIVALALVGAAGGSATAKPGEAGTPPAAPPQQNSAGWSHASSKMSAQELTAFRKAQGYKGDGKKDAVWLKSVRKKLGTGEFSAAATTPAGAASSAGVRTSSLAGTTATSRAYNPNALTTGPGYAYIGWLAQRRQVTNSACGKATVQEMSITVPGPSSTALTQVQVASYLGETTSSATNTDEELRALRHFVGMPNFGRSFYESAWLSDPPSSTQKTTFWTRLKTDMAHYKTPLVTGVIEVKDGPRLNGHPNLKRIEHWVMAGGWNDNNATVLYADSWTNYGYPIPAKSWISKSTFLHAAGGWGYQW